MSARKTDWKARALAAETALEPRLVEVNIKGGAIEMSLEDSTGLVHRLAVAMSTMLKGHGAKNYIEQQMSIGARGYVLTIQGRGTKTPHECRVEAENERDLLRAQLAVATATIADWARVTGCETPDDFEVTP